MHLCICLICVLQGCRVKDHIISLSELPSGGSDKDAGKSAMHRVYDDLLARRDTICVPFQRLSDLRSASVYIFPGAICMWLELDVFVFFCFIYEIVQHML